MPVSKSLLLTMLNEAPDPFQNQVLHIILCAPLDPDPNNSLSPVRIPNIIIVGAGIHVEFKAVSGSLSSLITIILPVAGSISLLELENQNQSRNIRIRFQTNMVGIRNTNLTAYNFWEILWACLRSGHFSLFIRVKIHLVTPCCDRAVDYLLVEYKFRRFLYNFAILYRILWIFKIKFHFFLYNSWTLN